MSAVLETDLSFLYMASRVLEFLNPDLKRLSLADITQDIRASMMDEVHAARTGAPRQSTAEHDGHGGRGGASIVDRVTGRRVTGRRVTGRRVTGRRVTGRRVTGHHVRSRGAAVCEMRRRGYRERSRILCIVTFGATYHEHAPPSMGWGDTWRRAGEETGGLKEPSTGCQAGRAPLQGDAG